MKVERLPAPYGGINTDAGPDYLESNQAAGLQNLLPGFKGVAPFRGPIDFGIQLPSSNTLLPLRACWTWNENILTVLPGDPAAVEGYLIDGTTTPGTWSKSAVSSALQAHACPYSNVYARYGPNGVFGAVFDGIDPTNAYVPKMGFWPAVALGTSAFLTDNAPMQFTDLQVHTHRLFVLSGTVPGAGEGSDVNVHTLYFTDPDAWGQIEVAATLDAWKDDATGLVNQINYDADDTPVGLAGCGKWMAILGSRSVNVLIGDGPSNYAVRNVSRDVGCVARDTIVEADNGFYFMSDRGYYFCDGSTLMPIGDGKLTRHWLGTIAEANGVQTACLFTSGYLGTCTWNGNGKGLLLCHLATQTWCEVTSAIFDLSSAFAVYPSPSAPLIWDGKNLWKADKITNPESLVSTQGDVDLGSTPHGISALWISHPAKLSSPSAMSQLKRILVDYILTFDTSAAGGVISLEVIRTDGLLLHTFTMPAQADTTYRQRAQFQGYGDADAVQLRFTYTPTGTPTFIKAELYDAWIEHEQGRDRPTFT